MTNITANTPLKKVNILSPGSPNRSTGLVGGEFSGILNWNDIAYPDMYDLYKTLLNNFWQASEINMQDDIKQWGRGDITPTEQHVLLRMATNLSSLDSAQAPLMNEITEYFSDAAVRHITSVIAQQEAVHNESYSYINSSLVELAEQNRRFDEANTDPIIQKRNKLILEAYEEFRANPTPLTMFKALVNAVNLEGIYFYAGFAYFYHLARNQKMAKTSTIISYIQRDEMQHAYFVSQLIRALLNEIPDLNTEENIDYVYRQIDKAVQHEKEWAHYILADITDIDLDEYDEYVEFLANKRFRQMGLDNFYEDRDNPMPWIHVFSDEMINETKSDFFEQKSRTYTKVSSANSFDEL